MKSIVQPRDARAVSSAIVALEGICKSYGAVKALDGVTLVIEPGITGLLGPNGAGKTTLIKVLMGLVRVSAGRGHVLGFELTEQAQAIRQHVGYMPEDDCYIAGLSGVEMVQFAARLSGQPPVEALRRSHEILDFCGVEQERYRAVDTYSTGMRQKLKFAQAIVHDPSFLILDEPTAGLDPDERIAMLHRISVLSSKFGKSVLLSTHILPDVRETCQMVVIVARGKVRVTDALDALSRPTSPTLHIRTSTDPKSLIDLIRCSGGNVTIGSDGTLQVFVDRPDAERQIWLWADEAGVALRSLVPARNSLEQIFMETVRGEDHADS